MSNPSKQIGLALSGGGFRAAAFHLGTLKRLEEVGLLRDVKTLSCVSGGSITGALLALRSADTGNQGSPVFPVDDLIAELTPVLLTNLRAPAYFGSPLRTALFALSWFSRRVSRVGLIGRQLDRQLFQNAKLSALPPWILINATNLRTGKGWKFYNDRAGDYLVGATDKTNTIRVADAVAASAAYPVFTDAFGFRTTWEDMRGDLLDRGRWQRPQEGVAGGFSRWRERFGKSKGKVVFPLVDGGLYDNDGANGLRGTRVTHAILSGVAPPEDDEGSGFGPKRFLRMIVVIHDRLGAATRQHVHEMTHGVPPVGAATALEGLAATLDTLASASDAPAEFRDRLKEAAAETQRQLPVGFPPRGHQYLASAQILLHRQDLTDNTFAAPEWGGLQVPLEYRGLAGPIVAELSRVRTDFDALEPEILGLLVAQAYFLTDVLLKSSMPELLAAPGGTTDWYSPSLAPTWPVALAAVRDANANQQDTIQRIKVAQGRAVFLGRRAPIWARVWFGCLAAVVIGTLGLSAALFTWGLFLALRSVSAWMAW